MIIGFDEGHNQVWTIDPTLALFLSSQSNESYSKYSYAKAAKILEESLRAKCVRITRAPLDSRSLEDVNILVINHHCDSTKGQIGVGGECDFSPQEIAEVVRAVEGGMGLLVIGEFDHEQWGTNVNELIAKFGLSFRNDVATIEASSAEGRVELAIFEIEPSNSHPAVQGVSAVTFHSGCTVEILASTSRSIVELKDGRALAAISEFGRGRIGVVGDSDLFSEPFLASSDNAALLVSMMAWLGKINPAEASLPIMTGRFEKKMARSFVYGPDSARPRGEAPDAGIVLAESEKREILAAYKTVTVAPLDLEEFCLQSKLAFHRFPDRLRRALIVFGRDGNESGAIFIRNLPVDPDLVPTPVSSGDATGKKTSISEFILAAVGSAIGEPVSYLQEKGGALFQDMFPTKKSENVQSSESSAVLLEFHTEIAFHPFMPDYILLFGLRQDPAKEASTIFAGIRKMLHLLTPHDHDLLFSDVFRTGIDYSFGNVDQLKGRGPLASVLYGDRLDPFLRYDLDLMISETNAGRTVLEKVRKLVNSIKQGVKVEAGSLVVLDNRRCVHARTNFKANYDGNDRWLQRLSVVRDLRLSMSDRIRGTRTIATDFSPYLADEIG